jgi:mRNA interferase HigB
MPVRTVPSKPAAIVALAFPVWEPENVRVISRRAIREFAEARPEALEPLQHWATAIEAVEWRKPGDVRRTFNTADFFGDLTVFDVGGNKYRVITFVHYRRKAVYIKHVLTHKEYDKGAWKP